MIRRTHGTAGTFDLVLPLSGSPGIEMRSGTNRTLVLTFDPDITAATATIASGVPTVSGAPGLSGNTVTVQLSGVTDRQTVTLRLQNVAGASGTTADVFVGVSFLTGDVNQSGATTLSDMNLVTANSGSALDESTFRYDTNAGKRQRGSVPSINTSHAWHGGHL